MVVIRVITPMRYNKVELVKYVNQIEIERIIIRMSNLSNGTILLKIDFMNAPRKKHGI